MSRILTSIGINAYKVLSSRRTGDLHEVEVALRKKSSACLRSPCKGARLQSKGRYRRTVRHLDSMGAATRLIIHARRFRCLSCRRSFVQPLPGILPGKHSSEPFRQHVYTLHHEGIPNSNTGRITRIAPATVGRIFSEFTLKKAKERISSHCPRVLGIDEHTLHKKTRFASTLCDLANHRVFDLFEGKSATSLHDAFTQLSGRDRVRVVCIDLSIAYRSIVRTFFPNALIVADRFHVIRVVQHHFLQFARQIAPTLDGRRGHLGLFRKKPDTLQPAQRARL